MKKLTPAKKKKTARDGVDILKKENLKPCPVQQKNAVKRTFPAGRTHFVNPSKNESKSECLC